LIDWCQALPLMGGFFIGGWGGVWGILDDLHPCRIAKKVFNIFDKNNFNLKGDSRHSIINGQEFIWTKKRFFFVLTIN
jgi:hypothetical protein